MNIKNAILSCKKIMRQKEEDKFSISIANYLLKNVLITSY